MAKKKVESVPEPEAWLYKNPKALKMVSEGLEDARSGCVSDGPNMNAEKTTKKKKMAKKKTKKVKKPEPKYIYLSYDEYRSGGEVEEGQSENDRYASREDTDIDFQPRGISVELGNRIDIDNIQVNFNPLDYVDKRIYLVIVRYSTGDTFGHTNGAWCIEGAYLTDLEAINVRDSINNDSYKGKYPDWKGYFERLESAGVESFILHQHVGVKDH